MKRWEFIDGWRGLAIILMVINHVGHYLVPPWYYDWSYLLIYWTVTLAAPIFLFLAGLSMALSLDKIPLNLDKNKLKIFWKIFKRGMLLVALGLLVNLFYYIDEPIWRGRILMCLGLSSILLYPFIYLTQARLGRMATLVGSIVALMLLPLVAPSLQMLAVSQPIIGQIFLSEFPLYPWFFLVLIGLIAGQEFLARGELKKSERKFLLTVGGVLLLAWLILSIIFYGANIFAFSNDVIIARYWNPAPITWLWILGWLNILAVMFYGLGQAGKLNQWLVALGRQSIYMYFLQFFLIIIVGHNILRLVATDLFSFTILTIIIIIILCLSTRFKLSAISTRLSRLKARVRIF